MSFFDEDFDADYDDDWEHSDENDGLGLTAEEERQFAEEDAEILAKQNAKKECEL